MKAMVNPGGCSNNEIVKGCFYYYCSYLCSGVQVALLVFLFDAQLFHPHEREIQRAASSLLWGLALIIEKINLLNKAYGLCS